MTTTHLSTRRSFIWTAGAAFSAPLAAVAASVPADTGDIGDDPEARLAMLEEVNAIRALNQTFARHLAAGAHEEIAGLYCDASAAAIRSEIRRLSTDHFGERDVIEIAADRQTAAALLHCMVEAETVISPSCPLVEMARQQGGGVVRRTERGVFENTYVKRDGIWKIQRSSYRLAQADLDPRVPGPASRGA